MYNNSLVNVDFFYANFTKATFQNIPIPHLPRHSELEWDFWVG